MTREQAFGLMAAIDADDTDLYRTRLANILGQPGRGNAARTTSRRQRAGRTAHQAARRRTTVTETIADPRQLDDPAGIDNPYWATVRTLPGDDITAKYRQRWGPRSFPDRRTGETGPSRDDLVKTFSWAITDPTAVAFVAEHAGPRIIEVGAGTGYWAWQIAQRGADVIAYDQDPPDLRPNHYHAPRIENGKPVGLARTWYPVLAGCGADVAAAHTDRTLLLSWPPYDQPMAADTLAAYRGDTLVYIGEGAGGCTGDDRFHQMLGYTGWAEDGNEKPAPATEWDEVASHRPVQWWGLHDVITVYRRQPA